MTNSDEYTCVIKTDIQEIHEQQTHRSFDEPTMLEAPQVGLVVLRIMGFGVVTMISFDLTEAQVGDIAIKTTHNGFIPRHKLGPRSRMDQVDGKL
jgi:hypothetical protein